jgi:hypothetical protein
MASMYGGFGGLQLPAAAVTSSAVLDPGHEALVGLISTAINSELTSAWRSTIATLGADHFLLRDNCIKPVGYTSTIETTDQQRTQFKAEWPLLSVYREGEPELLYLQNGYQSWKQNWSVDWIIGPLTSPHINKVGRFAIAVARVIMCVIDDGHHPDYQGDVCQFFGQFVVVKTTAIAGPGVQHSMSEDAGSGYYGLTVTLETIERRFDDAVATAYDKFYVGATDPRATPLGEVVTTVDAEGLTATPIPPTS